MPDAVPMRTIVFVCTGNICRSPLAEAMATQRAPDVLAADGRPLAELVHFESAGTASWHVGDAMDPRAHRALLDAGYSPHDHEAQHAGDELLARADLLVALDRKHRQILSGRATSAREIVMLRPFDPAASGRVDVADPYYGTDVDFSECATTIERCVAGLLAKIAAGAL